MTLLENIIIDQYTQGKIDTGALSISDHVLLSLANFCATLYPAATVYIGAQQQEVETPALFVDFYSMTNQQKLADTSNYAFGFVITYVPSDKLSAAELNGAIFTIQQALYKIPSELGELVCYSKNGDITDGLANVTGSITVREIDKGTDPMIQIAEQELRI